MPDSHVHETLEKTLDELKSAVDSLGSAADAGTRSTKKAAAQASAKAAKVGARAAKSQRHLTASAKHSGRRARAGAAGAGRRVEHFVTDGAAPTVVAAGRHGKSAAKTTARGAQRKPVPVGLALLVLVALIVFRRRLPLVK